MRAVFFCNEMFGLGHLNRSTALAAALASHDVETTALVVTGSPAGYAPVLPPRVDVLRLPTPSPDAHTGWSATSLRASAGLGLAAEEVHALRSELSLAALRAFVPDLVVVDHQPTGRADELLAALQWCRSETDAMIALGLRDIDDDPQPLRQEWSAERSDVVSELYDLALVYGASADGDVRLQSLEAAGVPIHHTGLVAAPPARSAPHDLEPGYLLVTAGGGVDGFELLHAVVEAVGHAELDVRVVIVTGPMMDGDQVAQIRAAALEHDKVQVFGYRHDFAAVLAGARAVVAMAGYCTVAEILASGKPALLVPRAFPRREQLNRAERWAAAGRVGLIETQDLQPSRLSEAIAQLLDQPAHSPQPATGATQAAAILHEAVTRRARSGRVR